MLPKDERDHQESTNYETDYNSGCVPFCGRTPVKSEKKQDAADDEDEGTNPIHAKEFLESGFGYSTGGGSREALGGLAGFDLLSEKKESQSRCDHTTRQAANN